MTTFLRGAVLVALCVALASCGDAARPQAASVNGREIPMADVTEALERFEKTGQFDQLAQQSDPGTARRQFEQAYLGQQIRSLVLAPRADALGIDVTDEDIDRRIEQIKASFPSEKEFAAALEDQGLSEADLSDLVGDQLVEERLRAEVTRDTLPTAREVDRYYRANEESFQETEVSHILVDKAGLARRLSGQLRAAPEGRRAELFVELARKHSSDPSAREGGELGWVGPGQLVEPFEVAMRDLRIGEISAPVPSDFGIHIIRVTDRRIQAFEDVREQITQQLAGTASEESWSDWVADAYRSADVDVNPRYGELDPSTGQVTNADAADVPGAAEGSPSPTPG
jgi:parvulin-like peptidyl-prolyl isomerase